MGQMEKYTPNAYKMCELTASRILERRAQPIIWPTPVMLPYWFFGKNFLKELYLTIKKLEDKGLNDDDIAKLFYSPSRIAYLFFYIADFPLTDSGLSIREREDLIEKLFSYIKYYRKEDIYCENLRDVIWSSKEINSALSEYQFLEIKKDSDEEIRKIFGRFNATLFLYEEFIQMGRHQFAHQFHGPYSLENGDILFVREHKELKPTYVWDFTAKVEYNAINTLEIYEGVNIRLPFFNHIESTGNLPAQLKKFVMVIPETKEIISQPSTIQKIAERFEETISLGNKKTSDWDEKQWLKKSVEMGYALLKPHKEVLREDWHPPQFIYDLIESKVTDAKEASRNLVLSAQGIFKMPRNEALPALQKLLLKNVYAED